MAVEACSLRAQLWPRLVAVAWALCDRAPDGRVAPAAAARWLAVCAAIDAGDAVTAVAGLGELEAGAGPARGHRCGEGA